MIDGAKGLGSDDGESSAESRVCHRIRAEGLACTSAASLERPTYEEAKRDLKACGLSWTSSTSRAWTKGSRRR